MSYLVRCPCCEKPKRIDLRPDRSGSMYRCSDCNYWIQTCPPRVPGFRGLAYKA